MPEIENDYPEPGRFGPIPAQGFFIRHVKNIAMRDVEIRVTPPDLRPAFILEDVDGADFMHIKAPRDAGSVFALKNVRNFELVQSRPLPDTYLENAAEKTV